jgi:hypothetical protein
MDPEKVREFPNGTTAGWIRLVLNFLVVPVFVWLIMLDRDVTTIKANRFTAEDGQEVWKAISSMPPRLILEAKVDGLVNSVNQIQVDVARLRAQVEFLTSPPPGG